MPPTSSTSSSDRLRLLRRLTRFTPVAALIVATNSLVDPATGMLAGSFERRAVEQLLAGHPVVRGENDRLLQTLYLESARAPVEVLVLGSSRSLPINTEQLGGRSLWNAAVAAAFIEEQAVLYLQARRSRLAPRMLLLGVDVMGPRPPAFRQAHARAWFNGFAPASRELGVRLLPALDMAFLRARWPLEPFSPQDFQRGFLRAVRRLVRREGLHARDSDVLAAPDTTAGRLVRSSDGSVGFTPWTRGVAAPVHARSGHDPNLDPNRLRVFDALVARILADGRQLVLVLPPYRRDYASLFGGRLAEAEAQLRGRAKAWSVPVIGSFDAASCGCRDEDFRDDIHPLSSCFDRFLAGHLPESRP
jgi:hypothetical protein